MRYSLKLSKRQYKTSDFTISPLIMSFKSWETMKYYLSIVFNDFLVMINRYTKTEEILKSIKTFLYRFQIP